MGFFKEFHDQGKFVKSINASFLVLIPKKGGAEDLKDFRPISLVGSLYKLLAKVLTNRLKKVMGKLVSKSQNAFVEGRQILDASLIANEAIHSMQNSGGGGILCKLDIEKAYDHVNWSFLFWLMEMMGFGAKWISWIQWCIGTVNFSVLINGTSSGFFKSSRGLRQGDPLSPYLFVIVMEDLSCLLKRAKEGGFLSGWQLSGRGGGGVEITHLLFADDTLVFCEPSTDQVSYLSWLLMWFEAMSGLKVNLDKSEIIAVGRVENVEEVALEFGCKVSRLPSTYLGLPLGARFKEVATWDGVEERLRKRLSIWKRQYISKGGRMTLIRSTLSSMPIYCMSLFQMPRSVSLRLERIQRDFLWGGGALERKPHLVEWSIICSDKRKGGLGVRSLALLNKALLCKWSWRFAVEREALWRQVISAKYGEEEGGWRSCVVRGSFGVGLWKAIRRGWEAVGNNLAYAVGNGRRIRFWEDKWCGDDKLCSLFPSLYAISLDKEAWVADVWSHSGGGVWAPRFSRSINDWEVIEVERLLLRLQGRRVYSDVEDEVIWTKAKDKRFSVKSLYKDLDPERREEFPANIIWNSVVPPRVSFFVWEATWKKSITLDRLQRRGFSLANRCYLCLVEEESIDHILLHCGLARSLWSFLFSLFGVSWVLPSSIREALLGWLGPCVGKERRKVWRAAPLCLFWIVWKERNSRAFENVDHTFQGCKSVLLCNLWAWSRGLFVSGPTSVVDFVDWIGHG
ncbi:putative ribonuclease H protein [Vitis vinifera]|uniref:Putative ribonuclease H protein n=1 Tax=Vitis vinifera TaxID=29760 RepID=A0A438J4L4_VITVI|nr:putative ribonuclease H protein [Vitis vinifera]